MTCRSEIGNVSVLSVVIVMYFLNQSRLFTLTDAIQNFRMSIRGKFGEWVLNFVLSSRVKSRCVLQLQLNYTNAVRV